MDPGPASEDVEVGNVRDATSEGLVWHSPFEQFAWTSVDHMNGDGECFDPEAVLHSGMMEECLYSRPDGLVHSLSKTVLLGSVWCRHFADDSFVHEEGIEFFSHEFTTTI